MNRSILLVICDFLLLSLLALASFDSPGERETQEAPQAQSDMATSATQELMEMLHVTLESEREAKEQLSSELSRTRSSLAETSEELAQSRTQLTDVTRSLSEKEELAQTLEQQRAQLAEERERLRQTASQLTSQRDDLEQRVASTQQALSSAEEQRRALEQERESLSTNLSRLEREATLAQERAARLQEERTSITTDLSQTREDATVARERLRQIQEELQRQQEALAATQAEREKIAREREEAERARQQLATELAVSSTRMQTLEQNLESARSEIAIVRGEKDRLMSHTDELAQGVRQVAEQSGRIVDTIRDAQPISSNEIYDRHRRNSVRLRFTGTSSGLFGERSFENEVRSIFATDGRRTFILAHRGSSPFSGTSAPVSVSARAIVNGKNYAVNHVAFLTSDPRIIAIQVDPSLPQQAGVTAFPLEPELFRFSEAVLVANNEDRFGETKFTLDPDANLGGISHYLRMDTRVLSKLFGDFSPSRGDVVFSKSGGVIGIMGNNRFATRIDAFLLGEKIDLGDRYNNAEANRVMSRLQLAENRLPFVVR